MKKFFTLVELMVVVAIIVILAGILLPTLAGGREKAAAAKCMSNMKQLGSGMVLFASDNNNCLLNHVNNEAKSWAGNLLDYVKETKLYYCEADEKDSSSDEVNIGKTCLVSYMANTNVHTAADNKKIYTVERTTQTMSLGPRSGADLGSINPPGTELERHGKTSNYLFVDGHAEAIKKDNFQANDKEELKYWSNGKD